MNSLKNRLKTIDGQGYKSYKKITGQYQFPRYKLMVDHIQGDPFAQPSRFSLQLSRVQMGFPDSLWDCLELCDSLELSNSPEQCNSLELHKTGKSIRCIALEDFLGRKLHQAIHKIAKGDRGTGISGLIDIAVNGQKVLQRNAVLIGPDIIEVRLVMGMPARHRRVSAKDALVMLFDELPRIIDASLLYQNLSAEQLNNFLDSIEDQEFLRNALKPLKLTAFVANGSRLPRQSGISDKPSNEPVIPFQSPADLEISIDLPHYGIVTGMGIPEGINLIVGGGFHGKSTLLKALQDGPYNHIPGDGRERVVSHASAVKIRAEDGRAINKINISPFINHLPLNRDTVRFSTENASGSTSQAANIIEALLCGSSLLLFDEDTCATNFMIRDEKMQALVSDDKEPITPLLFRIKELYSKYQVSAIIVMGGSGDYFDIANTVIMLDEYQVKEVTEKARALAVSSPLHNTSKNLPDFKLVASRRPGQKTLDASRQNHKVKIDCKETAILNYGRYRVDLVAVEQLVDVGQTQAIGLMLYYYSQHVITDKENDLITQLKVLLEKADESGLDIFNPYKAGNLAMPRLYELAAALNRIRSDDWY
jgi:predicted ABC-class ATPase